MLAVSLHVTETVIAFTSDGGLNWQLQTMPANALDVNLWKVSFVGARR